MELKENPINVSRKEKAAARRRNEHIRNSLLIGGSLFIFAAIIIVSFSKSVAQTVVSPRIGSTLGNFVLQDINGKTVHLSDYCHSNSLIF